jgi:tetratricopeptide (TPR) repeat protein
MGIMRVLPLVLALAFSLLPSPRAVAQPLAPSVTPAAQPHLDRALRHFFVRDYTKALVEFRAAYTIDPQPALLYAIAQAERLNGECRRAIRLYEAYLRTGPNERQAVLARRNIERCQSDLKRPPPASRPVAQPLSAPSEPPEPALAPLPPRSPPPVDHGPSWVRDWVGHGLVLGGLAVAATGIALWRIGHTTIDDANASPDYDTFASRAGRASTADIEQKVGVAGMAVGGALVAAGVLHYALRGGGRSERARVAAALGPGGAHLVLAGRF